MSIRHVLCGLAALGLIVGGFQALAQDEKTPAGKETLSDPGLRTLVIKRVEVKGTKANGDAWDVNDGKPDLRVIVRNLTDKGAKDYQTETKDDTTSAVFGEPSPKEQMFFFLRDQDVEFEVVDVDVAVNDLIGKTSVTMSAKNIKPGPMKIEGFGQVISLSYEIREGRSVAGALAIHEGLVVKAGNNKLTMTKKDGKDEHTHAVPLKASVTCDGRECRLEDLKSGAWVRMTTRANNTDALIIEAKNNK